jgi:hypothetical protein
VLGLPADVGRDDWLAFATLLPLVVAAHLLGADRESTRARTCRLPRSSRPS